MAVGLLISCDGSKFYSVDFTRKIDTLEKNDTLFYNGVIKNNAEIRNILCTEKYLIVVQNDNDTIFRIIDVKCDSIVANFGQIGHASNEFSQVPFFYYISNDEEGNELLCVQEIDRTKVIDIEKTILEGKCIIKKTILEKESPTTHSCYYFGKNEKIVNKTITSPDVRELTREKPIYTYYNGQKEEKKWEIYPELVKTDNPNLLNLFYTDRFFVKNDGTKALSMMKFIDYFTIFDLKSLKTLGIINRQSYDFDWLNNEITSENLTKKLIIYNLSAYVNNENIILLKDYRLYKEMFESTDDAYYSHISIFNWDGEFRYSYIMDRSLWDIAYIKSVNTLYGVSLNLDKIYKYKLKLN